MSRYYNVGGQNIDSVLSCYGEEKKIEIISVPIQTVAVGQNVLFSQTAVKGGCAERHRGGSGQVTLTKPGRYLVTFSGNLAVPTGETPGEVSVGIAQAGEIIPGTAMRATPGAVDQYFNVSAQTYVNVYCNCCETVSVENAGAIPVNVQDANISVVRVCG